MNGQLGEFQHRHQARSVGLGRLAASHLALLGEELADASLRQVEFVLKRQALAGRRHLAAIAALASLQKLQARTATRPETSHPVPPIPPTVEVQPGPCSPPTDSGDDPDAAVVASIPYHEPVDRANSRKKLSRPRRTDA